MSCDPAASANDDIDIGRAYARAVLNRTLTGDADPLMPRDHVVNWDARPLPFKTYRDRPRQRLVDTRGVASGTLVDALKAFDGEPRHLTTERLSALLFLSGGLIRRKLDVVWNGDSGVKVDHCHSILTRPYPSGGALYPVETYVVLGDGPMLPGVYHYDVAHHALETLSLGDSRRCVQTACRDQQMPAAFVLLSLMFWRSAFKYHNLAYQLMTQDLGCALGALRAAARALGFRSQIRLWFDDRAMGELIGVDSAEEAVFAVVGMDAAAPSECPVTARARPTKVPCATEPSTLASALPVFENLHRASLVDGRASPPATRAQCRPSDGTRPRVTLPAGATRALDVNLSRALKVRASRAGTLTATTRLGLGDAAMLLSRGAAAGYHDAQTSAEPTGLSRLMMVANHVQDLPPGAYDYDAHAHQLCRVRDGDLHPPLQRALLAPSYNLEQASLVLVVVVDLEAALQTFGNRGLRILNAEAGLVAHAVYLTAAALGLGCGAVLGFTNAAVNRLLGLDICRQTSLLLLAAGVQRPGQANFENSFA